MHLFTKTQSHEKRSKKAKAHSTKKNNSNLGSRNTRKLDQNKHSNGLPYNIAWSVLFCVNHCI